MPRIAVAQWRQESNTFNPNPTTLADYERFGLTWDPAEILGRYAGSDELGGLLAAVAAAGADAVPLLRAVAWSGGTISAEAFDVLLARLLDPLRAALPVDGVLLSLHGATAAAGEPDVAGRVCCEVRALVGPGVPLGVSLDLHANLMPALLQAADVVVGYHTNPHLDLYETGLRAGELTLRLLRGEIRPSTALRKVPALIGAEHQSSFDGPLAGLFAAARAAEEAGGVLNANLYPVQPWLDVPGLASGVVVTTDGDPRTANALADELADRLWELRDVATGERLPAAEVAARVAAAERGPVVISDGADSTNSGAPGDSTVLMRAFLAAGTPGPLLVSVVDPEAAAACLAAGIGAVLTLPVGGKLDPRTGPPLRLTGRVKTLSDGRYRISGHGGTNVPVDAGPSAVLECGELLVALTSHTIIGSHPNVYRSLGLAPEAARAVVAKSPHGFRHDYGPFAAEILLADCPGAANGDYRGLTYQHTGRMLHPLAALATRHLPALDGLKVDAR